ncbi:MAG: protein-tyrosine phosphatase family protein [Symbiobacteriia bacterium]
MPGFEYSRLQKGLWAGRNPLFEKDVEELARLGIRHIIDLREPAEWTDPWFGQEALDALEAHGIRRMHLPVVDMGAPDAETLTRAVETIQAALAAGEPLYIHCRAGMERTGAVLVAWRASTRGESYDKALGALRSNRPILNPLPRQREAVEAWLEARARNK